MYEVSDAYKIAKEKSIHRFKIDGTIDGVKFDEDNILEGSLSISNKFNNGNEILVGSVNIGTLKCTFRKVDIKEKAEIVLSEGLRLEDGSYEYVPMGVYHVAEAVKSRSGIAVTAYDNMYLFDKKFNLNTTYGFPFDLISYACKECNVILGMTRMDVENLPNGTQKLWLYIENDIETWRDFLYWLAQAMGCIATIDRRGMLVFRQFSRKSIDVIDSKHRFSGANFSEFSVRYSGISVVNIEQQTTSYYGTDDDKYLTYNLGSNPLLQYGDANYKDELRKAILYSIANINYTPFIAKVNVGAMYDIGDVIEHTEGLASGTNLACIMNYEWKFKGGYKMEGIGKNPNLANVRSKIDKSIQGLLSQQQSDEIQYYTFINANKIEIADGKDEKVIDIRFASNKATTVIFNSELILDVETTEDELNYNDAICTVSYRMNDYSLLNFHPTEIYSDGKHVLNLMYPIEIDSATMNRIEVFINSIGGKITIEVGDIRALVYGQSLVATDKWDGTIEVEEYIPNVEVSEQHIPKFMRIHSDVDISQQIPIVNDSIKETIQNIKIRTQSYVIVNGILDETNITIGGLE